MRLSKALEEKLLDVRLRDKLLTEGKVTKKQLEDYLKNLQDDHKNSTHTSVGEQAQQRQ